MLMGLSTRGTLHSGEWGLAVCIAGKEPACSSCEEILPVMSDKLDNGKYK